ncbi:MAG: PEP-CTERM sorting domain-containing protein [Pseudomonadota bacterium]|nr:PEP-CTERM sorting domain-containing protein [Pseudomonadota bacterium]
MNSIRLLALFCLAALAQGALGSTIYLKDADGNVCYNSLSNNVGGYVGLGSIDSGGNFTMTISNPLAGVMTPATGKCLTIPKTSTATIPNANVTFTGGSVAPSIETISTAGTGPYDAGDCLDQGTNLVGVTGSRTGLVVGASTWSITFSFIASEGCAGLPTKDQPFLRSVSVKKKTGATTASSNGVVYHVFNVNSVPEPATTLLLLAGGLGFAALGLRRRRAALAAA